MITEEINKILKEWNDKISKLLVADIENIKIELLARQSQLKISQLKIQLYTYLKVIFLVEKIIFWSKMLIFLAKKVISSV